MTDGIIQKVMSQSNSKTFLKRLFDNLHYDYAVMIRDYFYQDRLAIQQELIEEIKKEFSTEDLYTIYAPKFVLKRLIGDNE